MYTLTEDRQFVIGFVIVPDKVQSILVTRHLRSKKKSLT